MARTLPVLAFCFLPLGLGGCSLVAEPASFLMPDGRAASFVTLPGDGTTPPVVAVITPKASAYNVQVVSATPVVQSLLQGAVAGVAVGGGLAAQGALIRPDRVINTNNASGQGGSATGGNATGGAATGGNACVGTC